MIFNGHEKSYVRVNIDISRPTTPPIEFTTRQKSAGGSKKVKKRFRDMYLPVPVTIYGRPTVEDVKEDLAAWLVHPEPKRLSFKGKPDRYYLAELESINLDERKYRAKGIINFFLSDPQRYGEHKQLSLTPTTQLLEVTGQTSTPWSLEVDFTTSASRFEMWAGETYLQLNHTFVAGDKLIVNYLKREVFLNGQDFRKIVSMSSHFKELEAGYHDNFRATHNAILKYEERFY